MVMIVKCFDLKIMFYFFISIYMCVCIISLYIIPGYAYPLTSIQWRVAEDYVLFGYSDDTVFVWQVI